MWSDVHDVGTRMKIPLFLIAGILLLSNVSTTVFAAKPADTVAFQRLRAAVCDVPGWIEQMDKYRAFTAKELYGLIDGRAADYNKQGLKSGITVTLTNGDRVLEIYFEDFGNPSRAKGMAGIKKKSFSAPKKLPQVNISPAFYDQVLGGCVACWAKGKFYIEMTLTGYDAVEIAVVNAAVLINSISPFIAK